jgi:hypothetical protein
MASGLNTREGAGIFLKIIFLPSTLPVCFHILKAFLKKFEFFFFASN